MAYRGHAITLPAAGGTGKTSTAAKLMRWKGGVRGRRLGLPCRGRHAARLREADVPQPDPSRSQLSRAGAVAWACLASELAERRVREPAYDELLQTESQRLALERVAVRDLARLSRFRAVSALPVAATRMVLAAAGRSIASEEAPAAAGRFARTLDAHGSRVDWYVSAHTHRALESALEGCPTRYINTGTWCSDVRGRGPDQSDRLVFPYAVIDVAPDGVTGGGLRYFRPDGG